MGQICPISPLVFTYTGHAGELCVALARYYSTRPSGAVRTNCLYRSLVCSCLVRPFLLHRMIIGLPDTPLWFLRSDDSPDHNFDPLFQLFNNQTNPRKGLGGGTNVFFPALGFFGSCSLYYSNGSSLHNLRGNCRSRWFHSYNPVLDVIPQLLPMDC